MIEGIGIEAKAFTDDYEDLGEDIVVLNEAAVHFTVREAG